MFANSEEDMNWKATVLPHVFQDFKRNQQKVAKASGGVLRFPIMYFPVINRENVSISWKKIFSCIVM